MAIDFKNQTPKNTLPANGVIFGADDPNSTSPSTYTKSALVDPNVVKSISGGTTGLTPAAPTSGDVVISGTLAVANGGTGVTTKTGTGNVVLSDNPTLVSPVLGQPASGDLTNCTNLPLTTGITGVLDETHGGTGQSSYTIGDLLYASSTTALSKLPDAATGNALISGGIGAPPSWGKVGLTTHVDGTLPLANGGTGVTSLSALQTSIFPSQSGNSGKYLTTNGSTTSWAGSGKIPLFYDLVTDLRSVTPTAGAVAVAGGYYANGDGAGGDFYAVTTGGPYNDNGGTIITFGGVNGASSAWLRVYDNAVSVSWFGAKGDAVTDDTTAIQNAINSKTGVFPNTVVFPTGIYLANNLKQSENQQFIVGEGRCRIYKNANGPLLTCTGDFISFGNIDFNGANISTGSVYTGSNVLCFPTAVASFTASMTGTGGTGTFTATGLTGSIATGNKIYGDGVPLNATVGSNVSGNTWNFTYEVKSIYKDPVSLTNVAMITSTASDVTHVSFQNCSSRTAGFRALISKGITKIYGTNVNGTWNTATTGAIFTGVITSGATQGTLTVTPPSGGFTKVVGIINPGDQLSGTGIVGGVVVSVASGVTIVSQVTNTDPDGTPGKAGTYLVSNNLPVPSIMMKTNIFNYDIEIGCPGVATLYHQLTNVYTSNNLGGVAFIDAGSPFLIGSEIGKLYIGKTTALSGQNAGVFCSNRTTGDVTVELSNGLFLGNQFGENVIYFGSGTSLCSLDRTNLGFLSTIINDGNSNNFIEVNTSTGGTADWRIGPSNSVANFKLNMNSGLYELPGSVLMQNARSLSIKDSSGVTQNAIVLSNSNVWTVGSNSGTGKWTSILSGDLGIFLNVAGTNITQATTSAFRPQGTVTSNVSNITLGANSNRWGALFAAYWALGSSSTTLRWGELSGAFAPTAARDVGSLSIRELAGNNEPVLYIREKDSAGTNVWRPIKTSLTGSATYDPPNLIDGDGVTTTLTVTGAALGDYVTSVSFSLDIQGITVTGWVSAADTVSVRFQNETGGAIDLASGTLRAQVQKA